jgi:hypothetical protein
LINDIKDLLKLDSGVAVKPVLSDSNIDTFANKFDETNKVLKLSNITKMNAVTEKITKLNKIKAKQSAAAKLALKLKLPAPPSLYSPEEEQQLMNEHKQLTEPPRQLSKHQKAQCAINYDEITALQNKISDLSMNANSNNYARIDLYTTELNKLQDTYNSTCGSSA